MKTTALITFVLLSSFTAFSQKSVVTAKLKTYKISPGIIDSFAVHHIDKYAYDLKSNLVLDGTEKVSVGRYDPSLAAEEQWKLISVNGSKPGKGDINTFEKTHNVHIPPPSPDSSSWKIVKEDAKGLVVSFQYLPSTLTEDNSFMADCVITLTFNTATGDLLKSESEIAKPFKIKMFNAKYMNTNATYVKAPDGNTFLPKHEEVTINLRMLGHPVEMVTINDYSNYKKP